MNINAFAQGLNNGLRTGMDFARMQEDRQDRQEDRLYRQQSRQFASENLEAQRQRQQQEMGFHQYENALREHQRELGLLISARSSAEQSGNHDLLKRLDKSLIEGINRTPRLQQFISQGAPEGGYKKLTGFKNAGDGRFAIGVDTFDENDKKISSSYLSRDRSANPDDPYLLGNRESAFRFLHDNPDVAPHVIEALGAKSQISVKDRIDIYKAAHEYAEAQGRIRFEEKDSLTGEIVPQHILYQRAYEQFLAGFGIGANPKKDPLATVFGSRAAKEKKTSGTKGEEAPPPPLGFMEGLNARQRKAAEEENALQENLINSRNHTFLPFPGHSPEPEAQYHQFPWFPSP